MTTSDWKNPYRKIEILSIILIRDVEITFTDPYCVKAGITRAVISSLVSNRKSKRL